VLFVEHCWQRPRCKEKPLRDRQQGQMLLHPVQQPASIGAAPFGFARPARQKVLGS